MPVGAGVKPPANAPLACRFRRPRMFRSALQCDLSKHQEVATVMAAAAGASIAAGGHLPRSGACALIPACHDPLSLQPSTLFGPTFNFGRKMDDYSTAAAQQHAGMFSFVVCIVCARLQQLVGRGACDRDSRKWAGMTSVQRGGSLPRRTRRGPRGVSGSVRRGRAVQPPAALPPRSPRPLSARPAVKVAACIEGARARARPWLRTPRARGR